MANYKVTVFESDLDLAHDPTRHRTPSGVKIEHLPTGRTAQSSDTLSMTKNRDAAMEKLARIVDEYEGRAVQADVVLRFSDVNYGYDDPQFFRAVIESIRLGFDLEIHLFGKLAEAARECWVERKSESFQQGFVWVDAESFEPTGGVRC